MTSGRLASPSVPLNLGMYERNVIVEIRVHGHHRELVLLELLVRVDDLLSDAATQ
jgi:hypothetical protein